MIQSCTPSLLCVQDLELALNELTPEGVPDLATALRGMVALRRLNLRENELESAGAVALAPALASLSALKELDLSGNQIKRAGAVAVARAVARLPAFERLLLDENEISADGVAQVKVRHKSICWLCARVCIVMQSMCFASAEAVSTAPQREFTNAARRPSSRGSCCVRQS